MKNNLIVSALTSITFFSSITALQTRAILRTARCLRPTQLARINAPYHIQKRTIRDERLHVPENNDTKQPANGIHNVIRGATAGTVAHIGWTGAACAAVLNYTETIDCAFCPDSNAQLAAIALVTGLPFAWKVSEAAGGKSGQTAWMATTTAVAAAAVGAFAYDVYKSSNKAVEAPNKKAKK